jgi:hypothetical protein
LELKTLLSGGDSLQSDCRRQISDEAEVGFVVGKVLVDRYPSLIAKSLALQPFVYLSPPERGIGRTKNHESRYLMLYLVILKYIYPIPNTQYPVPAH